MYGNLKKPSSNVSIQPFVHPLLFLAATFIFVFWAGVWARPPEREVESSAPRLVFVLSVGNLPQVRSAEFLLKSLRTFGGSLSRSDVLVTYTADAYPYCTSLSALQVRLFPLEIDSAAVDYPFARKVSASAQAEKLLAGEACTLVWLDNECISIQSCLCTTVKGLNAGKDVFSLMQSIHLPDHLRAGITEDYGRVSWSVRGIYEGYVGWFDGNVANMYDESVAEIYQTLVKLSGGSAAILAEAKELLRQSEPVKALRMSDIVLYDSPADTSACHVRMQALEMLRGKTVNWIEFNWLNAEIKRLRTLSLKKDK